MIKNKTEFSNLVSREERHFCAYLFAWFLMDKENIKKYFQNHSKSLFKDIEKVNFQDCELYYEYTGIRELIYFERYVNKDPENASKIKQEAEYLIFKSKKGDVQKKKADFAFYFPSEKMLVLTEAKFEMRYDKNQFGETLRYGKFLKKKFPDAIREVKLSLLGLEYYNNKNDDEASISWENLTRIIDNSIIQEEIIKGLIYQKTIHEGKEAMRNWEIQ